jgi:hypothetical protein
VNRVRRETAIHEAGHATAAAHIGQEVTSIEIGFAGAGLCRTREPRLPLRESVLNFCIVAYAGICASAQIESEEGIGTDLANIRRKLATIADPREREKIEREARALAECGFRRIPAGYSDLKPAGIPI